MLAAIRSLNRFELDGETMRRALSELAEADPTWLQGKPNRNGTHAMHTAWSLYGYRRTRKKLILENDMDGIFLTDSLLEADGKKRLRKLQGVKI